MIKISAKTHENNGIEAIVDDHVWVKTLRLNKKDIEDKLSHKNLPAITNKYNPIYENHRYELVDQPGKQPKSRFLRNE